MLEEGKLVRIEVREDGGITGRKSEVLRRKYELDNENGSVFVRNILEEL